MNNIKDALTIVNDYARSVKISSESPIDPVYNWTDAVHELTSLYAAKEKVSKLPTSARRTATLRLIEAYLSEPMFDERVIPNLTHALKNKTNQNNQIVAENVKLKQKLAEMPKQFDEDKIFFFQIANELTELSSARKVKGEDVNDIASRLRNYVKQFNS